MNSVINNIQRQSELKNVALQCMQSNVINKPDMILL